MTARSPYEILNVSKGAEDVVIHAAYKALMKEYHPDIHSPDGPRRRKAAEISAAFALLKDPDKRAAYDQEAQARHSAFPVMPTAMPASPGRSATLAVSGWLTALALAAVLFVVWTKPPGAPLAGQAAERDAGRQTSASPTERDAARIKEELQEMRNMTADYVPPELRLAPAPGPSNAPAPDPSVLVAGPVPIPEPRIARPPSDRTIPSYRRRLPQQHKRGGRTPDEEFMEREGYIY